MKGATNIDNLYQLNLRLKISLPQLSIVGLISDAIGDIFAQHFHYFSQTLFGVAVLAVPNTLQRSLISMMVLSSRDFKRFFTCVQT